MHVIHSFLRGSRFWDSPTNPSSMCVYMKYHNSCMPDAQGLKLLCMARDFNLGAHLAPVFGFMHCGNEVKGLNGGKYFIQA
jgi:hypothetical protein